MILALTLSDIIDVIIVIGVIIVVLVLLGSGTFIYFYKFRKTRGVTENNVDYSGLNRQDTKDYIKIEDIKDDMIISDNGRRFVAAVTCFGNDFFDMQGEERLATKNAYTSFIGVIDRPFVYRQSTKAVDMVGHIDRYEKRIEHVRKQCVAFSIDYEDMKMEANKLKAAGDIKTLEILLDAMEKTESQVRIYNDRLQRLEEQLQFIKICANGVYAVDTESVYIFSYESRVEDFSHEPTKEEVYDKAVTELRNKANAYINALSGAKVRARRCTTKELELMCYRYFHPVSGVMISDTDYGNSSDFVDFITSPVKDDIYRDFINEQGKKIAIQNMDAALKLMEEEKKNEQEEEKILDEVVAVLSGNDYQTDESDVHEAAKKVPHSKRKRRSNNIQSGTEVTLNDMANKEDNLYQF